MIDHREALQRQQMESPGVRVGDRAVLWELQAFLRNVYFITVIFLCVIAVG